jgi:transcriptional regulator GlxA family with amidase domain
MVLYLIARYAGATDAQEVARLFALQWHQDGLTPFIVFEGKRPRRRRDPERAAVAERPLLGRQPGGGDDQAIEARRAHVQAALRRATGLTPIAYVQRLRIEDAKRRLERTDASVDEISWRVGYEDAAFFRRLFKRTTGLAPGAYRKRFRIPDFARPSHRRQ